MQTIVIAQQGWVFVGTVTAETESELVLDDAAVVRRWGTTRGLGQLAAEGPTGRTVLDPCETVRISRTAIIATLDCKPW
jgi:hypothetical protein